MLNKLKFPASLEYSSDGKYLPIEFYLNAIPLCSRIDLKLGYFSSNAIRALAYGFAQFIFNGGTLRIITNHFLSKDDKTILFEEPIEEYASLEVEKLLKNDLVALAKVIEKGDQHFFSCLRYLYKNNRLVIQPVKLATGGMSHYKQGVFYDSDHIVAFNGSCNFTYAGLIENGESFSISRSWGELSEKAKIEEYQDNFESIFKKENESFEYLEVNDIVEVIKEKGLEKDLQQLVDDEIEFLRKLNERPRFKNAYTEHIKAFEKQVNNLRNKPRFPYLDGPRDYQKQAYKKWKSNNFQGIFAMATGTGKTITSLNCLLEIYNDTGLFQALILVPTNDLQAQWVNEVNKFNIHSVISVGNDGDWKRKLSKLTTSLQFGNNKSFIVISTYASFIRNALQNFLNYLPKETLLIADEAHNIAATKVRKFLSSTHLEKRIGLSATPKRIYDAEGTKEMNVFFNDEPPYTFEYSMEEAIAKGVLCQYDYYPHLVRLSEDEMEAYKEITLKLVRFFDAYTGKFRDEQAANMLLIKRKRIVHNATNKLSKFQEIIKEEFKRRGNLKYTFVYVPEGFDSQNEDERMMRHYNQIIMDTHPTIRVSTFMGETEGREAILNTFEEGEIEVLTAMKCLDEGVDVPRAELAIFCSSTGNPRQFIQRRGRILRTHIDKKHAVIHDLVVTPSFESSDRDSSTYKMEKTLVENELKRVADFAYLARNQYDAVAKVESLCEQYELNLFEIRENIK